MSSLGFGAELFSVIKKGYAMQDKKPLMIIDGSGFLYRAYYGMRPLHTSKGVPVQAVYSFCRMIGKLIDQFKADHVALVWDSKGKTTRHEIYPAYKATRQEAPSDLSQQKELIMQFADLIGLKQYAQQGIEADDLMYALAKKYAAEGHQILLVTSDKDMAQMIDEQIQIYDPFKDQTLDKKAFEEKMGFEVEKLPFYHALLGDSSDNIPGVHGIGKKGATDLVQQFASLADLYEHLDAVSKPRMRAALEENKENALLSHQLFLLRDVPISGSFQECAFDKERTWPNAYPLFLELEFKSLVPAAAQPTKQPEQLSLFASTPALLPTAQVHTYKTITSPAELQNLIKAIKARGLVAIDTEGTQLDPLRSEMIGICLAIEKGTGYYIPFGHTTNETQLSRDEVLSALKPIFQDPAIKKIMHHAKYDQLTLWCAGIPANHVAFDTLIAAQLVTDDWQSIGLKKLSEYYLHESMLTFAEVVKENKYKNFSEVPLKLATDYAAADAHQTLRLVPILEQKLKELGMEDLFYAIEMPTMHILCVMEQAGIYCDPAVLKELDVHVSRDLAVLKDDIMALIGQEHSAINLNSPKQLAHLLFEVLHLPPVKKSAKKTGYSTDVEVLEELARLHPVPRLILKYRELYKLKSTYIDALPSYINPDTGKIHTSFSQTQVATGRLSSSEPNLQNVPLTSEYPIHIRSAFKPDAGQRFISADYSQIELRVLAYLSQDEALLTAFANNLDIHAQTASKLFDVTLDQVTSAQRQIGKRINFSILYGLTPFGLAKDLNIPHKDAKQYIDTYFAQYPGVKAWMDSVVRDAEVNGYVTTHFGRRRSVPGLKERNKHLYDLAKRIAINTVAQGTAAEIMKKGMIACQQRLQEAAIPAQLILQIHDELLIMSPEEYAAQAEALIREALESVVSWNVALQVTTRIGRDWYEVSK
jgi:DNA polymerase-1